MNAFVIRKALESDAKDILESHRAAVREKAAAFYSDDIVESWSPSVVSEERIKKMENQIRHGDFYTLVACAEEGLLGFGQVSPQQNILGAVYVRKNPYSHVGKRILEKLLQYAKEKGARYLEMDASLNAESFYSGAGFRVVSYEMHRLKSGLEMNCVKMRIDL